MNIVTETVAKFKDLEKQKLTINYCRMRDLDLVGAMRLVGRWFGQMK